MEPRLRSRGSASAVWRQVGFDLPSMEPRLRSRGSMHASQLKPIALGPSMEPRLRSRGSKAAGRDHGRQPVATLQWSRGCEAAEAWYSPFYVEACPGEPFNGAAAAKPRKRETMTSTSLPHQALLQWSRGCEAAEAPRWSQARGHPSSLQWSRGCEAAEARRSMGYHRSASAYSYPSMEPRLRSRGSATVAQTRWLRHSTFNGAAAAKPRKLEAAFLRSRQSRFAHPSMEPRLRSRGSQPASARVPVSRPFNGAAAAKPRKPGGRPLWPREDRFLVPSMEPRLRSRGSVACGRHLTGPHVLPSMEPRLRSRGS